MTCVDSIYNSSLVLGLSICLSNLIVSNEILSLFLKFVMQVDENLVLQENIAESRNCLLEKLLEKHTIVFCDYRFDQQNSLLT
jgi:hypothetical protein